MMEAASTSEVTVNAYSTAWRSNPGYSYLQEVFSFQNTILFSI
jgi:hypothetical protein